MASVFECSPIDLTKKMQLQRRPAARSSLKMASALPAMSRRYHQALLPPYAPYSQYQLQQTTHWQSSEALIVPRLSPGVPLQHQSAAYDERAGSTSPDSRHAHVLTPPSESSSPVIGVKPDWEHEEQEELRPSPPTHGPAVAAAATPARPAPEFLISKLLMSNEALPINPEIGGSNHHHQQQPQTEQQQQQSTPAPKSLKALPLPFGSNPELLLDPEVKAEFLQFRSLMMDSIKQNQEGTNAKMRRSNAGHASNGGGGGGPDDEKRDPLYLARRSKNNEAAKRSRDLRRAKEYETTIRAAFFESAYRKEKNENNALRLQNEHLKFLLSRYQG